MEGELTCIIKMHDLVLDGYQVLILITITTCENSGERNKFNYELCSSNTYFVTMVIKVIYNQELVVLNLHNNIHIHNNVMWD